MKDKLEALVGWVVVLLILFGPAAAGAIFDSTSDETSAVEPEPTCITESIPYDTDEEETDELDVGDWEIAVDGEDGEREICTDADGNEVSNDITVAPVNELKRIGTYEAPVYDDYEYNDVGCPMNQYVSGYYRSNGTYVDGYYRNSPSDSCY